MKYCILGKSGLRVSQICLGTMTFGEEFGWGNSRQESRKVFDYFLDMGGNFIDTANHYTKGTSEKLLGEFIEHKRNQIVLATKYTLNTSPKDPNAGGNHRKNMVRSLEDSLKRLQTDYIDLFYLHIWDETTPIEEILRAFDDLVKSGKILHVGLSDTPAWIIAKGDTLASFRGYSPIVAMQLEYSLIERSIEREYFDMSKSLDIPIVAWSPLGMGVLSGKYNERKGNQTKEARFQVNPTWGESYLKEKNMQIAKKVVKIAKDAARSPTQVALNWILQKSPLMIPIIGAKTQSQLEENLGCLDFVLTSQQMKELDEVSHFDLGFPYNFIHKKNILDSIFGDNEILDF
ncbi:MAG: aldo/keto reductase [Chlamydia sp. 32-24]|nr:MAG: aldo/keto reductase [Chlamydia sp. 32-24]